MKNKEIIMWESILSITEQSDADYLIFSGVNNIFDNFYGDRLKHELYLFLENEE